MEVFIMALVLMIFIGMLSRNAYQNHKDNELLETVTPRYRGTPSERRLILDLLEMGFNKGAVFHDLYLKKENGKYSQVDAVLATKSGIVVIEVKDYGGWIFGSGGNTYWTQVMAYGNEKYRFYNPVLQNQSHIRTLKSLIKGNPDIPYYSVIVFYGSSKLKSIDHIPKNTYVVYSYGLPQVLLEILRTPPAKYQDKHEILAVLQEGVSNGNDKEIQLKHIESIQDFLDKN